MVEVVFFLNGASDRPRRPASGPSQHRAGCSKRPVLLAALPAGYQAIGPVFVEVREDRFSEDGRHTAASDRLAGHIFRLALLAARPGSSPEKAEQEYLACASMAGASHLRSEDLSRYLSRAAAASALLPMGRTTGNRSATCFVSTVRVVLPSGFPVEGATEGDLAEHTGSRSRG